MDRHRPIGASIDHHRPSTDDVAAPSSMGPSEDAAELLPGRRHSGVPSHDDDDDDAARDARALSESPKESAEPIVGRPSEAAAASEKTAEVGDEVVRKHWLQLHTLWSGQLSVGRMRREARETSQRLARPPESVRSMASPAATMYEFGSGPAALANFFMQSFGNAVTAAALRHQQHHNNQRTIEAHQYNNRLLMDGLHLRPPPPIMQTLPALFDVLPRQAVAPRPDVHLSDLLHRSLYDAQPSHNEGSGGTTLEPIDAATALSAAPPNADGSLPRCPICLEDLQPPTATASAAAAPADWTTFPCCRQPVHLACAQRALHDNARCPMCRTIVP